jgi:hypothetical protein
MTRENNTSQLYLCGNRLETIPKEPYAMKATDECRAQVNAKLLEFLHSDSDCIELKFGDDFLPHPVFRARFNIKTCGNCWDQYEIAVLQGWPDVIGVLKRSFSAVDEGAVMLNEVLSDNYSDSVYVPLGYAPRTECVSDCDCKK